MCRDTGVNAQPFSRSNAFPFFSSAVRWLLLTGRRGKTCGSIVSLAISIGDK